MHLRGKRPAEHCHRCGGSGKVKVSSFDYSGWHPCNWCHGDRWVTSSVPHYRGCHVLDALLGLE